MVAIQFAPPPAQTGGVVDPNEILRREELARALQQRSAGIQPIESPWQGLAQISDAVFGGMAQKRATDERSANAKFLADAMGSYAQGDLSPDKLNQVMVLNPELGMSLIEEQRRRADAAAAEAEEAAQKQQVSAALRAMGATQEADAFDAGIIPAAKAYEILIANQTPDQQRIITGPDGRPYYEDGTALLPDVQPPEQFGGDQFDTESGLRKEYQGQQGFKDFNEQSQAYQRVLDSARDASPAGDLALIFNYMKVLDPGSVVRESEFATAAASGSFGDRIQAATQKVLGGERLSPDMRADFVKRAGDLYKGAADLYGGLNERYSGLAQGYGIDPGRIIAEPPKIGVLDPEFNLEAYLAPDGSQTQPLPVTNEADYQAIPSGAQYVDPEGNIRTKR